MIDSHNDFRRRHLEFGGYACGEKTRARIIAAALRAFGECGYDRASTRRIAERAGVNAAAIQYYFGGKQGLHSACSRHVIEGVASILALPLARARDARTAKPAAALGALCELLAAVVDGLAVAGSENWNRNVAYFTTDGGLFDATVQLVAAATRHSPDAKLTRLRACTLLGYVSSLYENRVHTLAMMGWSHFDEHALVLIKSVVCEHTRGALATAAASSTQAGRRHRGPGWAQSGG
jgi:TetR/AcrR family transcriptional regulator, regulator of cefoperazone and chloramphenicol sensitivity